MSLFGGKKENYKDKKSLVIYYIYWSTSILGNYASGNDNFIRKIGF